MSNLSSSEKEYRITNGRLSLYKKWTSTFADWDNIWLEGNIEKILNKKITNLGEIDFIKNYLPKQEIILEAGCGNGWVVQALALAGYEVEGIDYAENSIALINKIAPQLNIRLGNVFSIDVSDNYYGAYISLGVLEHNIEGPSTALHEAYRVLHPGGVGIFTIPYLNKTRKKIFAKLNENKIHNSSLHFYQYYFSRAEFSQFLAQAGFEIIDVIPIGLFFGLQADNPIFAYFEDHNFFNWRLRNTIYRTCQSASSSLRWYSGHMLTYICKKV